MIYLLAYGIWNVIVALVYGIDKVKAKRASWRISEACLLTLAFLMGAVGALCGMYLFRHKTTKPKFKLGVPLLLIVNVVMLWGFYTLMK